MPMIDYYDVFINSLVKKGYRNKLLFLASLNALQSGKPIEPLFKRAILLGLSKSETECTINSAKRYVKHLQDIFYIEIKNGMIFDNEGNVVNLKEHTEYQLRCMFNFGDNIVLGVKNDIDDSFKYKYASFDELVANPEICDEFTMVKVNPMDRGLSDMHVVSFKNGLVENDTLPIEEQFRIIKNSNLPIKLVVYSGNKSLHTIVDVNAKDINEYKSRINKLYDYAVELGLNPDVQCKSPSRYTRLAGKLRGGIPQLVILRNNNISYEDFEGFTNKSPRSISLSDLITIKRQDNHIAIDGLLKEKQCMMLFGEAKIGKTFLLMQLACALSYGGEWIGFHTRKGNVLYVNMEVDELTLADRFKAVMDKMDCIPDNIYCLNYRGVTTNVIELISNLEKELKHIPNLKYIIIDPVYKITGDDNSAVDVKAMFGYIDKLLNRGYTVIFCHHTHKAYWKQSVTDQFAGSSVYARSVDTLISIKPVDKTQCKIMMEFRARSFPDKYKLFLKFEYPIHTLV